MAGIYQRRRRVADDRLTRRASELIPPPVPAFVGAVATPDSRHHRRQIRQNACRAALSASSSAAPKRERAETGRVALYPPLLGIRAAGAPAVRVKRVVVKKRVALAFCTVASVSAPQVADRLVRDRADQKVCLGLARQKSAA